MRLRILFEDLDDKDEFAPTCNFCTVRTSHIAPEDMDAFHNAHMEYRQALDRRFAPGNTPTARRGVSLKAAMAKHGFVWIPDCLDQPLRYGHWARKPLKEDLDDKDEFSSNYAGCPFGCTDQDRELHDAHRAALRAGDEAQEQSYSELDSLPLSTEERHKRIHIIWSKAFDLEMNRRGYVSKVPSTSLTTNGFYANVWTKR